MLQINEEATEAATATAIMFAPRSFVIPQTFIADMRSFLQSSKTKRCCLLENMFKFCFRVVRIMSILSVGITEGKGDAFRCCNRFFIAIHII